MRCLRIHGRVGCVSEAFLVSAVHPAVFGSLRFFGSQADLARLMLSILRIVLSSLPVAPGRFLLSDLLTNIPEILLPPALLAPWATTCTTGKPPSWAPQTLRTPEVCFSFPSISQPTTHSSPLRSTSPPRSTTLISTAPAPSV